MLMLFIFFFFCDDKIINLDYDEYKGWIVIGCVYVGCMRKGMEVKVNFGVFYVVGYFDIEIWLILVLSLF